MLYPIIRRVRRPLLPPDDLPKPVVPVVATPVEESSAVVPVLPDASATQPKPAPDVPEIAAVEAVVPGELALAVVVPVPAEPVTEKPNKPTPTKNGRKTKTEKE